MTTISWQKEQNRIETLKALVEYQRRLGNHKLADILAEDLQVLQEQRQQAENFAFNVALMLEDEREFNRQQMKKTGYRVGVSI
jgi:hypothetical protein